MSSEKSSEVEKRAEEFDAGMQARDQSLPAGFESVFVIEGRTYFNATPGQSAKIDRSRYTFDVNMGAFYATPEKAVEQGITEQEHRQFEQQREAMKARDSSFAIQRGDMAAEPDGPAIRPTIPSKPVPLDGRAIKPQGPYEVIPFKDLTPDQMGDTQAYLNARWQAGWELVQITAGYITFKRREMPQPGHRGEDPAEIYRKPKDVMW